METLFASFHLVLAPCTRATTPPGPRTGPLSGSPDDDNLPLLPLWDMETPTTVSTLERQRGSVSHFTRLIPDGGTPDDAQSRSGMGSLAPLFANY